MITRRFLLALVLLLALPISSIPSCSMSRSGSEFTVNYTKKIILKKNKSFAEQLITKDVIYVIKYNFDLHNKSVVVPEGCALQFNGGTLDNGTIKGDNTQIIRNHNKNIFGNKLRLNGSFDGVAFSSYYTDNSIEQGLSNLFKCFDRVCLDKDYAFAHSVAINEKDVELDGGGHTISVLNIDGKAVLRFFKTKNVVVENLTLDFSKLKDISYTGETFEGLEIARVENSVVKNVNVRNVNSSNFSQAKSFFGVLVGQLHEGYQTLIDSVCVENIHILGNGVVGDNYGGVSAICVGHSNPKAGNAIIKNITINDVIDVDANGNEIAEDAGGIHINAFYYDNGILHYGNLPTIITNCQFTNISKRLIKLQASGVVVDGITCNQTKDLYCYAGIQTFAGTTVIRNCSGRYNGEFIRVSEQSDSVIVEDVNVESNYNKVFRNCLKSFVGVSAPNASVNLDRINVVLDGGRFVAVNNNLRLIANDVNAKANSLIYSLAAVSSFNGLLVFNHSNILLAGSFLVGKDVPFPIQFANTTIDVGTIIYRGFVTVNDSELRGGAMERQGNLFNFRGGLHATNSKIVDNKSQGLASHANFIVTEGDSYLDNVKFVTKGTSFTNGIVSTTASTSSIIIKQSECTDGNMNIVINREIQKVELEDMERVRLLGRGNGKPKVSVRRVSFDKNELSKAK